MRSKTISIDFDGVIARYDEGYRGLGVFGDIIPGTIEALEQLEADGWQIIICTARKELNRVRQYLIEHAIPFRYVTNEKPSASVYIDDRAIQFNGNWDEILPEIEDFEPWYYRGEH